jgi:hypothetical protein
LTSCRRSCEVMVAPAAGVPRNVAFADKIPGRIWADNRSETRCCVRVVSLQIREFRD